VVQAREELRRTGEWPSATTSPSDKGLAELPLGYAPHPPRRRNAADEEHTFLPPNPYPPGSRSAACRLGQVLKAVKVYQSSTSSAA
jgi:hypothetical protein